MKKVFIDTDIILDVFAKREPFYIYSAQLFTLADSKKIKIYVSALSFANINYILTKLKNASEARKILTRLKALVTVLPIDDKTIELALGSDFKDFEDAIQYYSAIGQKIKILITRNLPDYKMAKIPVMTAEEFIKKE